METFPKKIKIYRWRTEIYILILEYGEKFDLNEWRREIS